LKSYLAALPHEKRVIELSKFFIGHLVTLNNDILAEILTVLTQITEEEFTLDNEKIQGLLNSYEVEHAFIECIESIVRD